MDTDERLSKLEERVQAIEVIVEAAQAKLEAFTQSPGAKKVAAMFGVSLK